MCYYVQKMNCYEILKMRAEFTKDDNGTIWFVYASKIFARRIPGELENEKRVKKVSYINKQHQTTLLRQLKDHKLKALEQGNSNIEKLEKIMGDRY